MSFETATISQVDGLIASLEARKTQLLEDVRTERDRKHGVLRDQVNHCTSQLQRTTGLLQFSIEVLKEVDPAAFLQVSCDFIYCIRVSIIKGFYLKIAWGEATY